MNHWSFFYFLFRSVPFNYQIDWCSKKTKDIILGTALLLISFEFLNDRVQKMKVATVLASLFFSLPKEFDFFPKFFFVEGLDVANSLSRPPRSVIGIVSPPVSTVQPMQLSWPGHYQDKIRNIFPIRKILKNSVIDRQQRRIYYTRLCGQKKKWRRRGEQWQFGW